MATAGFTVPFSAVALTAATAKTVAYIKPASARTVTINAIEVTFNGASATDVPALVEICFGTAASNSTPGTGSTTVTPLQIRGQAATAGASAAKNCTSEPTVLTAVKQLYVPPTSGLVLQVPLGREFDGNPTTMAMFAVRVTATASVSASGSIEYEE